MVNSAKIDTTNAVAATDAPANPLVALVAEGQSVWLDYITRDLVRGGDLARLIEEDGLHGLTSNPTIFQKAIAAGDAYDDQVAELAGTGKDADEIFAALAVTDIREACDLFRPVHDRTGGEDGYVSIEVAPGLARDAAATLVEARRLWGAVDRPNAMIKVPGTAEGAAAVRQLLREGININVTLLFSLASHERVMQAYIEALEERVGAGQPVDGIASVASFFVSRIDALVDARLEAQILAADDPARKERLIDLLGTAAIANAKLAYAGFRAAFGGDRFAALRARGARVQRPLWASTGAKNPAHRDVRYVEELIGPDTVTTLPRPTLAAFKDHGVARRTVDGGADEARATLAALAEVGIDYDELTRQLEEEGIAAFAASYDELIAGVERKRAALRHGG